MNSFAVTFRADELLSVSEVVRNFSKILKSLFTKERKKICILNNNKPQAVIISFEMYETMIKKLAEYEAIDLEYFDYK
jgi:prevent-host-death family protein